MAWNTLILAVLCAVAVDGARARVRADRHAHRVSVQSSCCASLSVLPIITPPFVIGLGLDPDLRPLGARQPVPRMGVPHPADALDLRACRACCVAQVFAFTPIAFLVLIGVVEGVSPSMEEAAQTLRADRWRTFVDVSLPLMRPGLANAFLITFIESIADFGNPIILGGNFGVLSTESLLLRRRRAARPGARGDARHRAAACSRSAAFFAAAPGARPPRSTRRCPARAIPDLPTPLPDGARGLCYASRCRGQLLTIVIYAMALAGGFVETWGRDYTPTLKHYVEGVRRRMGTARHHLGRRGVELVLDDGEAVGDRARRSPRRSASSPPTC